MSASRSEAQATLVDVVDLAYDGISFGSTFDSKQTAIQDNLRGLFGPEVLGSVQEARAILRAFLSESTFHNHVLAAMRDYADAVGDQRSTSKDLDRVLLAVKDDMDAQSDTVKSREMTYGTPSADGGNQGGAHIYRLTVNQDGDDLEMVEAEDKLIKCLVDQTGTTKYREWFALRQDGSPGDAVAPSGSGIDDPIRALSEVDAARFITNPTFDSFAVDDPSAGTPTAIAATDDITGWELDNTNAEVFIDQPDPWREGPNEGTATALRFTDNNGIGQTFKDERQPKFTIGNPIIFGLSVYRESSCDGTLTLRLGATSRAIDVTTLTDAAWSFVALSRDSGLWPANFSENDMDLRIELSGRTTGSLGLDAVIVGGMTLIDGSFYSIVSKPSPPLFEDLWNWTDSAAVTAKIQEVLQRAGAVVTLPHATTGITIADP